MKMAKKITGLALAAAVLGLAAAPAAAQGEFLFNGYSRTVSGSLDAVGSAIEVYGILSSTGGLSTPIPLDLDNYQYTVHVHGMTVASFTSSAIPFPMKTIVYEGGELEIWADPVAGGTPADYGAVGTFTDGEQILTAHVDDGWTLPMNDIDGNGAFTGTGSGTCDFYGGTQLGALMDAEYYFVDWPFTAPPVADPNPPFTTVPPGFERLFAVKLVPPNDPSPTEPATWGQVKGLFR